MNDETKTKPPMDIDVRAEMVIDAQAGTDDDLRWTGRWEGYAGGETSVWDSIDNVLETAGATHEGYRAACEERDQRQARLDAVDAVLDGRPDDVPDDAWHAEDPLVYQAGKVFEGRRRALETAKRCGTERDETRAEVERLRTLSAQKGIDLCATLTERNDARDERESLRARVICLETIRDDLRIDNAGLVEALAEWGTWVTANSNSGLNVPPNAVAVAMGCAFPNHETGGQAMHHAGASPAPIPEDDLKAAAARWLDESRSYWDRLKNTPQGAAVVWASDDDGALAVFTRGEYAESIMAALPTEGLVPTHYFAPRDDDE